MPLSSPRSSTTFQALRPDVKGDTYGRELTCIEDFPGSLPDRFTTRTDPVGIGGFDPYAPPERNASGSARKPSPMSNTPAPSTNSSRNATLRAARMCNPHSLLWHLRPRGCPQPGQRRLPRWRPDHLRLQRPGRYRHPRPWRTR